MKIRNTLILLAILIGLGGYVYLVEFKQYEKKEQTRKEEKKLFSLVKDSVEVLEFKNINGDFAIKKLQDQWKITRPLYTEADEATINSMLTSLLGSEKDSEFSVKPEELPQFGLGQEAVAIRVTGRGNNEASIRLGDKTPVGAFVFAARSDSDVVTIGQSVKTSFEKNLFDIRDKKLLHFKRDDIRKMILRNPGQTLEFEKSGISDWIIAGLQRPADNGKINGILSKLENNRVKKFVDEEGTSLQKYGLSYPAYQVDLVLGPEQGQKKLFISRETDGTYYARDDARKPVFEVDSMLVKDISQKLSDFRNKDLAAFDRSTVNRLTIAYDDTLINCVKDTADQWFLDSLEGPVIIKQKIVSLFSNLDYTTISEFVKEGNINPAAYGLDHPSVQVSLYADENLVLEVKLGNRKGENVYAMTDQYDSVYLIPGTRLKDYRLHLDDMVEKPVQSTEDLEKEPQE